MKEKKTTSPIYHARIYLCPNGTIKDDQTTIVWEAQKTFADTESAINYVHDELWNILDCVWNYLDEECDFNESCRMFHLWSLQEAYENNVMDVVRIVDNVRSEWLRDAGYWCWYEPSIPKASALGEDEYYDSKLCFEINRLENESECD